MKTKDQREKMFRDDLEKLLNKHQAEMDLEIESFHGGSSHMLVTMFTILDDDTNTTHEYCEFEL